MTEMTGSTSHSHNNFQTTFLDLIPWENKESENHPLSQFPFHRNRELTCGIWWNQCLKQRDSTANWVYKWVLFQLKLFQLKWKWPLFSSSSFFSPVISFLFVQTTCQTKLHRMTLQWCRLNRSATQQIFAWFISLKSRQPAFFTGSLGETVEGLIHFFSTAMEEEMKLPWFLVTVFTGVLEVTWRMLSNS